MIFGLIIWMILMGILFIEAIVDGSCSSSVVLMETPLRMMALAEGVIGFGTFAPIWFDVSNKPRVRGTPRKGKKVRRRRVLWYCRRKNRRAKCATKRSASADSVFSDWLKGWADIIIPPARSIPDIFDEACRNNPQLIDMLCGFGDFSLLSPGLTKEKISSYLATLEPLAYANREGVDGCFQIQSVYFGEAHETPIVFDTGASTGVTPHRDDFIEFFSSDSQLTGIAQTASVCGKGTVCWHIRDDFGEIQEIRTQALYVPDAQVRLFSPQVHLQIETRGGKGEFRVTEGGSIFKFPFSKRRLTFHATHERLPIARLSTDCADDRLAFPVQSLLNVGVEENQNLSPAQRELKLLHDRLGHFNFPWIQRLTRVREGDNYNEPILATKLKATTSCQPPLCASCQFGKAKRRAIESENKTKVQAREGVLKEGILTPGQLVSTDQFVSSEKGRRSHTHGKEQEQDKFGCGTIFADTATTYLFVQNQVSTSSKETLKSKHAFEREARSFGVDIKEYRADLGVFKSQEFQKDLEIQGQRMHFSGVGAHHQNGIAENAIRTVTESARTMLLHAMIHWPNETSVDLWPFAVDYAVYLWNRLPKKDSGLAPIEVFSEVTMDTSVLQRMRVFGCPCYVLDTKIQDGKKLPKWKPKSRRGQFLGMSTRHSSTIGLIRNLHTGAVSPQFHVVYDELFTTIPLLPRDGVEEPEPKNWEELLTFSRDKVETEDGDELPLLHEDWLTDEEKRQREEFLKRQAQSRNLTPGPRKREFRVEENQIQDVDGQEDVPMLFPEGDDISDVEEEEIVAPRRVTRQRRWNRRYYGSDFVNRPVRSDRYYGPGDEEEVNVALSDMSEYGRDTERRLIEEIESEFGVLSENDAFLASLELNDDHLSSGNWGAHSLLMRWNTDEDGLLEDLHPLAFAAKANNEDTPNYYQAMNGPNAVGYRRAMEEEMDSMENLDPWDCVPRSEAIEKKANILPSTWAFKCKRYPDGRVKKLKARWCIRGDRQIEGVDFFETYAPVVSWSTVRLLLILSIVLGLATKQVDYTLAFVQADLNEEVFCEMPKGFERPGYVLKLKKSVYGLRQSPLNFFNCLKKGLEDRGFVQSKNEPCLFVSKKVICLTYVDDCLFFAREERDIDAVIDDLRNNEKFQRFQLKVEDDVAGFLGILIKRHDDGTIELLQEGLIDRILTTLGLQESRSNTTPAESKTLGKDENGEECIENWSYASVVGMMMYLASNSRPDIAFAVHQCARFTHCPKRVHEVALKRIGRYLRGTKERGMIIRPSDDLKLDLYVDADFAGLWNSEDANDPTSVKSRTGYVITLGGVPVLWGSKLQSEISLSTTEAEFIAASMAMRQLLPVREVMEELTEHFKIERSAESTISIVWEDNNGALTMMNSSYPKMTPRTKHIACKYWWFIEHIQEGIIEARRIDTKQQKADIFTKGLSKGEFETKRKLLMGW